MNTKNSNKKQLDDSNYVKDTLDKIIKEEIAKASKNKKFTALQNKINKHINCCEYQNRTQKLLLQRLDDKVHELEGKLKYSNIKICILFVFIVMICTILYLNN